MQFRFKCRFLNEEQQELVQIIAEVQKQMTVGTSEEHVQHVLEQKNEASWAAVGLHWSGKAGSVSRAGSCAVGCVSAPPQLIWGTAWAAEFQSSLVCSVSKRQPWFPVPRAALRENVGPVKMGIRKMDPRFCTVADSELSEIPSLGE